MLNMDYEAQCARTDTHPVHEWDDADEQIHYCHGLDAGPIDHDYVLSEYEDFVNHDRLCGYRYWRPDGTDDVSRADTCRRPRIEHRDQIEAVAPSLVKP